MSKNAKGCLILLIAAASLPAQVPTSATPPALAVNGAILTFSVPDLDASARWYVEKLGLRLVHLYPRDKAVPARAALFQGGGLLVELVQEDNAVDPGPQPRRGLAKAGLVVTNFDEAVRALRARGVEFASVYPRRPDQPANVTIRDNVGNAIALYEGFSSFDDPLIGLEQLDDASASCFDGRVIGPAALSGVSVSVYTKSPNGGAMGQPLGSASTDAMGRWKLPRNDRGLLIITLVPPPRSGYRGVFTTCVTSVTEPFLVRLPSAITSR